MHNMSHTKEAKRKMSEARKGVPNISRRRATIIDSGVILYRCGRCGEFKPYEDFYKDNRTILGIQSECKRCHCKTSIASRNKENSRRINREYMRRRRMEYSEIVRENDRKRSITRDKDEKYRARMLLNIAVRSGKIQRPARCERCDTVGKVYGHHTDYNKPLDVEWLCADCHGKQHRRRV